MAHGSQSLRATVDIHSARKQGHFTGMGAKSQYSLKQGVYLHLNLTPILLFSLLTSRAFADAHAGASSMIPLSPFNQSSCIMCYK